MSDATFWLVLAGVLIGSEMLTGTFYLLMLGVGALAGAAAQQMGASVTAQAGIASLVGLSACLAIWQFRAKQTERDAQNPGPNINQLDVGERVTVTEWLPDATCEVRHRGVKWVAVAANPSGPLQTGPHRIVAVNGLNLVIEAMNAKGE